MKRWLIFLIRFACTLAVLITGNHKFFLLIFIFVLYYPFFAISFCLFFLLFLETKYYYQRGWFKRGWILGPQSQGTITVFYGRMLFLRSSESSCTLLVLLIGVYQHRFYYFFIYLSLLFDNMKQVKGMLCIQNTFILHVFVFTPLGNVCLHWCRVGCCYAPL